jgi:ribosomal protein S19
MKSRSSWKIPTVLIGPRKSRGSFLFYSDIGKRISLYTGVKYQSLLVKNGMVGTRAGEFVHTKKYGSQIHSKKVKKK